MPKANVNGFEMYYEDGGEGPALVFIHGGFPSLQSALNAPVPYDWGWERDFAQHFHFVWYDRRGCYRSASPPEGYDLLNQARDLEGLLDYLHIPSTHLIGSSAGGPILVF